MNRRRLPHVTTTIVLHDEAGEELICTASASVCPPERDVGIMTSYLEDVSIKGPNGQEIENLTDAEVTQVCEAILDTYTNLRSW